MLWGTIKDDPSGRWLPGDWCCTSVVLSQIDDHTFMTKNTIYKLCGSGKTILLPVKSLILLRQGISPEHCHSEAIAEEMALMDFAAEVIGAMLPPTTDD